MSPEIALQGTTDLVYIDDEKKHELPERYNGLGFKNLIYMAIQAKQFHEDWVTTASNRPLCQIIFIEEPEVHLHAQVQQTFIKNIWSVLHDSAKTNEEPDLVPQLVVTTHSSHILETVDFVTVRYFQRCHLSDEDCAKVKIKNATNIRSLRKFQPDPIDLDEQKASEKEALDFLIRYLKLTHCDLFFADAVILIEGSVEKLLLPLMIDKAAPKLNVSYLSTLEVGGAYAHRFEGLLQFLDIPHLIITDIDSVEGAGESKNKACRADKDGAITSNATLKKLLGKTTIEDLAAIEFKDKISAENQRAVCFQTASSVTLDGGAESFLSRTLEEAFVYDNLKLFQDKKLSIGVDLPETSEELYEAVFKRIKSGSFKKTDFAMSMLSSTEEWSTPAYISEGLKWLEKLLHGESDSGETKP